ncbi:MAG: glutathione S-transferase family protein [Trichocoleus desertorum ATA4-8-CV12]|jgi:glutathione S-transferase|nr:glutathione S-transferase family protein [Trichocoleus desertorum ATA4-8-CV12]
MLKLYGGARSRASIVQWYLEEISIPYEFILLDMPAGAHLQPDFLAINPMGKVPAIVDGDYKLWESGAILLYLAEKYSQTPISPEQRGEIAQWILFANATLGPGIFVESSRERESARLFPALNQIFEQRPFLVGNDFSVADVAVGSMLAYMPMMLKLDFNAYPGIQDYLKRVTERPAYQKVMSARAA